MVLVDLTHDELRVAKQYVTDSKILEELEECLCSECKAKLKALKNR